MSKPVLADNQIALKTAPGRRARHPDGRLLEAGDTVERSPFWQRLVDAGDVVETAPRAEPAAEKKES